MVGFCKLFHCIINSEFAIKFTYTTRPSILSSNLLLKKCNTTSTLSLVLTHHIHVRKKMAPAGNECYNVFLFDGFYIWFVCISFFGVELGDWFEVVLGPWVMDQPGSEAVRIGAEADVSDGCLPAQGAGDPLWRRDLRCSTCYDNSRGDSGAVQFHVHPRNLVTLSAMDVKDRSSPWILPERNGIRRVQGGYALCFDRYEVKRNCECHWVIIRWSHGGRFFRPSLIASGVYPCIECLGFSNSNAKTWDEGAAMWIDEHVPWVIVATWSAARHASKVGLQRSALAKNSEFFTSASAPMTTASDPGWSITPDRRTTSNQSPNSTPKIEIHTNQMQNPSNKNTL